MRNLIKIILATIVFVSLPFATIENSASAASPVKIMWGKTELKIGQLGKLTVILDTPLVKLASDGTITTVRTLKKGEEYRVYSYKSNSNGLYGVGAGSFVQKNASIKYETPSKRKLEILAFKKLFQEANTLQTSTTRGYFTKLDLLALFNSHFTDWFTLQFISHSMMKKDINGVTHYHFMQGTDFINTNYFVADTFTWSGKTSIIHYQVPTVDKNNKKGVANLVKISETINEEMGSYTLTIILEKMENGSYKISEVQRN
ncbi:hypothetical protein [Paenisporosarcina sp. NPDC076898]|uniref:hypothetical protein n=1 Tax=unclassified Paenisporosarcina TaxID=2642018 RepID=UPI003CFE5377